MPGGRPPTNETERDGCQRRSVRRDGACQQVQSRSLQKVIDELRYWRDACHQKIVAGAGARDI